MVIRNASTQQIRDAAEAAGVEAQWTGNKTVRLFPINRKYGRVSLNGRKVHTVCFHGYFNFAEELFHLVPDAVIRSSVMGRVTAEDLWLTRFSTGAKRIRNLDISALYRDLCECE